ncbi:MAG: hypothetical protein K2X29_06420 [Candidatus Obscuribacterales bacterium]|nr:hypothetical protein [Candidatus Obscuribacterales bacterium]
MISDIGALQHESSHAGEAGISARICQSVWGPQDKEKNGAADRKSGGLAATFMETLDEGLYGKAYAQVLRGEDKADQQKVADAKVQDGFPPAKIVVGDQGYLAFGAVNDQLASKVETKTDNQTMQFLNFVDNRLAA